MRRLAHSAAYFACTVACTAVFVGYAQAPPPIEAPLPPRIIDEPGEAILAELPEDREAELEEIVVVGDEPWRLPDLGESWRIENEEAPQKSRVAFVALPLYDPELADRYPDLFLLNKNEERHGTIELFRIRFGRRPETDATPTAVEPNP